MERRTFLAALTAIPLAWLLPDIKQITEPQKFTVTFPDGTKFSFSGLVVGEYGEPIDLSKELPEMVTIKPIGPMTITELPYLSVDDARDHFVLKDLELPTLNRLELIDLPAFNEPFDPEALLGPSRGKITFKMNFLPN